MGWWVFAEPTLPQAPKLVSDPCYPEKRFVTPSEPFMLALLRMGARASTLTFFGGIFGDEIIAQSSFGTVSPVFLSPVPSLPRCAACSTWWPSGWNDDWCL